LDFSLKKENIIKNQIHYGIENIKENKNFKDNTVNDMSNNTVSRRKNDVHNNLFDFILRKETLNKKSFNKDNLPSEENVISNQEYKNFNINTDKNPEIYKEKKNFDKNFTQTQHKFDFYTIKENLINKLIDIRSNQEKEFSNKRIRFNIMADMNENNIVKMTNTEKNKLKIDLNLNNKNSNNKQFLSINIFNSKEKNLPKNIYSNREIPVTFNKTTLQKEIDKDNNYNNNSATEKISDILKINFNEKINKKISNLEVPKIEISKPNTQKEYFSFHLNNEKLNTKQYHKYIDKKGDEEKMIEIKANSETKSEIGNKKINIENIVNQNKNRGDIKIFDFEFNKEKLDYNKYHPIKNNTEFSKENKISIIENPILNIKKEEKKIKKKIEKKIIEIKSDKILKLKTFDQATLNLYNINNIEEIKVDKLESQSSIKNENKEINNLFKKKIKSDFHLNHEYLNKNQFNPQENRIVNEGTKILISKYILNKEKVMRKERKINNELKKESNFDFHLNHESLNNYRFRALENKITNEAKNISIKKEILSEEKKMTKTINNFDKTLKRKEIEFDFHLNHEILNKNKFHPQGNRIVNEEKNSLINLDAKNGNSSKNEFIQKNRKNEDFNFEILHETLKVKQYHHQKNKESSEKINVQKQNNVKNISDRNNEIKIIQNTDKEKFTINFDFKKEILTKNKFHPEITQNYKKYNLRRENKKVEVDKVIQNNKNKIELDLYPIRPKIKDNNKKEEKLNEEKNLGIEFNLKEVEISMEEIKKNPEFMGILLNLFNRTKNCKL